MAITREIFNHGRASPQKEALILGDRILNFGELIAQIESRSKTYSDVDGKTSWDLTINPSLDRLNQVIDGFARLHSGLSIVGFTSGSTGMAKRYRRTQASWIESFNADETEFGINKNDIVLAPGDLTHSLFFYAVCNALYRGATVILSETFRPDRVIRHITQHAPTVIYGVPTHFKLMLKALKSRAFCKNIHTGFPSVRWVLSSGSAWFGELTDPLQEIFPNSVIAEFYGASESSFVSLAKHKIDPYLPPGSVGKPFNRVRLRVSIPDSTRIDQSADDSGSSGVIWVTTPALFDRYQGTPPPDYDERIDHQGIRWITVGDCGYVRDNYLFLSGRLSRKMIISGKNMHPEEIEELLSGYPGIEYVAVIAAPDPKRGEKAVAILKLDASDKKYLSPSISRAELIRYLRPLADNFKIPRDYFFLDSWPQTSSGKTDLAALVNAFTSGSCRPISA